MNSLGSTAFAWALGRAGAGTSRAGGGWPSMASPSLCVMSPAPPRLRARSPAPPPITPTARTSARASLSLVRNIVVMTASTQEATRAEVARAVAWPDRIRIAARTVVLAQTLETTLRVTPGASTTASDLAESGNPRRTSRARNISRPAASRRRTVRADWSSCIAACSWVRLSRSQRTIGTRYRSGSRSSSAQASAQPSGLSISILSTRLAAISPPRCSSSRRLATSVQARAATRRATPNSQLAIEPRRRIDAALWARMRKVACEASSASCESCRTPPQTRKTIGPCRSTRAANASSSRRSTNRPSSSWSVSPTSVPTVNSVSNCRRVTVDSQLCHAWVAPGDVRIHQVVPGGGP